MSEPSLRDVQQWMKSRIRPGQAGGTQAATGLLNPQRGTPGEDRLAVYATGYLVRMREALAEVYEAVAHVLGEEEFSSLAKAYAARYPSHDYNLSLAGRHLPDLLNSSPLSRDPPFLPDLARLEWQGCEAFHAFHQPPMDLRQFATLPLEAWGEACVVFQPSVGVIESAWPILDLWTARQQPRDRVSVELINRPQRILVFRRGVQVACALLDAAQHQVVTALLAGRPLGAACDALASQTEEPLPLGEWFAQWVRDGLILRCELLPPANHPAARH